MKSKYIIIAVVGLFIRTVGVIAQENRTVFLDESLRIQQVKLTNQAFISSVKDYILPDTICINDKPKYVLVLSWLVEDSIKKITIVQLPLSSISQDDVLYSEVDKVKLILKKTFPESFYEVSPNYITLTNRDYFYLNNKTGEIVRIINPESFLRWHFIYENNLFKLEYKNCYPEKYID